MTDWVAVLNEHSSAWGGAMLRAVWQGGLALTLVWVLCRTFRRMPARPRCWLWRLAYLKLWVALAWAAPIAVPLLPPPAGQVEQAPMVLTRDIPTHAPALVGPEVSVSMPSTATLVVIPTSVSRRTLPRTASWLLAAWAAFHT